MGKDIFISYRRKGAKTEAILLYNKLTAAGYDVFLDFMSLHSGEFNEEIKETISGCKDFILLLSPNCFKRCEEPDDCFRQEIEWALKGKKHIIQIKVNQRNFPKKIPDSLKGLEKINALEFPQIQYADMLIQVLQQEGNLTSKPGNASLHQNPAQKPANPNDQKKEAYDRCHSCRSKNLRISDPLNRWLTAINIYIRFCWHFGAALLILFLCFIILYVLAEAISSTLPWIDGFLSAALPLQDEFWAMGTDPISKLKAINTVLLLICFIPWLVAYRTNQFAESMYLREAEKGYHWLSFHCVKCGSRYKEKLNLYFLPERNENPGLIYTILVLPFFMAAVALLWTILTNLINPINYPWIPFLSFITVTMASRAILINRVNVHLEQVPRFSPLKSAYFFINDVIDALGESGSDQDSSSEE